ncbi:hypothetical protein EDB85DRAFT_1899197 [Lactarius pseudohatsudake]|nr:hypothetical protein EDB85DRAFT_1899197 [Lactarius pseudohatsudake]
MGGVGRDGGGGAGVVTWHAWRSGVMADRHGWSGTGWRWWGWGRDVAHMACCVVVASGQVDGLKLAVMVGSGGWGSDERKKKNKKNKKKTYLNERVGVVVDLANRVGGAVVVVLHVVTAWHRDGAFTWRGTGGGGPRADVWQGGGSFRTAGWWWLKTWLRQKVVAGRGGGGGGGNDVAL